MRSPFALLRKWWKIRTRREAVPPWHVTVKIAKAVSVYDEPEVYDAPVKLTAGGFAFKLPDQITAKPTEGVIALKLPDHAVISVHTQGKPTNE